jgi:hypothetical protein
MSATTSFHRNDAGREFFRQSHDGLALHATPQDNFARAIKPDNAATVLA